MLVSYCSRAQWESYAYLLVKGIGTTDSTRRGQIPSPVRLGVALSLLFTAQSILMLFVLLSSQSWGKGGCSHASLTSRETEGQAEWVGLAWSLKASWWNWRLHVWLSLLLCLARHSVDLATHLYKPLLFSVAFLLGGLPSLPPIPFFSTFFPTFLVSIFCPLWIMLSMFLLLKLDSLGIAFTFPVESHWATNVSAFSDTISGTVLPTEQYAYVPNAWRCFYH